MKKLSGVSGLLSYIKKRIVTFTLLLLLSLMVSLISLLPVQLIGFLVDLLGNTPITGIEKLFINIIGNQPTYVIVAFGVVYIGEAILSQCYGYSVSKFTYKIVEDVRCDLFGWIVRGSDGLLEKNISGDIITRCVNDAEEIRRVLAGPMNGLLTSVLKLIFSLVILALWNLKIAAISIIIVLILYNLSIWISKINKEIAMEERSIIGSMSNMLSDILENIPLIKSYCSEDAEIEKLKSNSSDIFGCRKRNLKYMNVYWTLIYGINTIGLILTFLLLYFEIKNGRCSAGDVIVAYTYLTSMYNSMISISRYATDIFKADASLSKIFVLMKKESDYDIIEDRAERKPTGVRLKDVSISYGDRQIMKNVNLVVEPGQMLAIVGKSGVGKSTIINALSGFLKIDDGTIYVGDYAFHNKVSRMPEIMRVCFQKPYLFRRTLKENMLYGGDNDNAYFDDCCKLLDIDDILKARGEDYRLDSVNQNLSGGEQRRLAFCRTVNKKVPLYLFDEPTAELDQKSQENVISALRSIKGKATIIVVTHDEKISDLADCVYQMKNE